MSNKFNRSINHLASNVSEGEVVEAIQAVENLFSSEWLTEKKEHRLQILWQRRDHLSTSELYALGKSILNLSLNNRKWLESNAKTIKKNASSAHGFLTEIINIGSLSVKEGVIKPYPDSYKTYDYAINYPSGYEFKVSVKNFDISDHERKFHQMGSMIRETFTNMLKRRSMSGQLMVVIENDLLTEERVRSICMFVCFRMESYGEYVQESGLVQIFFNRISEYSPNQLVSSSDKVIIIAKQHYNEQRNIISKVDGANADLLKEKEDVKALKHLNIRLGETTDIDVIHNHLEKIAENQVLCGFDTYHIYQPTVVTDLEKDTSTICTTVRYGSRRHYDLESNIEEKLKNVSIITNDIHVGSISTQKSPPILCDGRAENSVKFMNHYCFQKGDIYLKAKRVRGGYEGPLSKVAPGVLTHLVISNMILSPVVYASSERLLII